MSEQIIIKSKVVKKLLILLFQNKITDTTEYQNKKSKFSLTDLVLTCHDDLTYEKRKSLFLERFYFMPPIFSWILSTLTLLVAVKKRNVGV